MAEMESLSFDINLKSGDTAKQLDSLAASLNNIKKAVSGGMKLSNVPNQIKKLDEVLSGLNNYNVAKLNNFTKAIANLQTVSNLKISGSVAKGIGEISKAAESITPQSIQNLNSFSQALQGLGKLGNMKLPSLANANANASQAAAAAPAAAAFSGSQMVQPASRAIGIFKKLGSVSNSAFGAIKNMAKGLRSVGTAVAGPALGGIKSFVTYSAKLPMLLGSRLAGAIKNVTGGLGGMFSGLLRIAKFRFFRTIIKMFTEGLSQGVTNLYEYSRVAGTDFAASMDRIATSANYVKNSLGAMVGPLIQTVAPAIDFIGDKVVGLFNTVNQLIARLSGKDTYTAAKKISTTWQEATDDAGNGAAETVKKTADKIKRYTLGFDELNILGKTEKGDSSTSSTKGKKGKKNTADYGSMFEQLPIDNNISQFADRVKRAIQNGDWEGAGELFGQKINEIVEKFDWAGWGKKIGKGIDNGIAFLYGMLKKINFDNIGKKFAEFFNNLLEPIDFNRLGRLLVRGITSMLDLVLGFIEKFDFKQLSAKISDFFIGIWDEASEWLNSKEWKKIGKMLYNKLKELISGIKFASLVKSFFRFLGSSLRAGNDLINGFADGVATDIKKFFDTNIKGKNWKESGENILKAIGGGLVDISLWVATNIIDPFMGAFLGEDQWKELKTAGKNAIEGFLNGIREFFNDPLKWVKEHVVDPFVNNLKGLLGIKSPSTVLYAIGKNTIIGFLNGIVDFFKTPYKWVKEHITDPIKNAIKKLNPLGWLGGDDKKGKTVKVSFKAIKDKAWDTITKKYESIKNSTAVKTVKSVVKKAFWDNDAWSAANKKEGSTARTLSQNVKQGGWNGTAWSAAEKVSETINRVLSQTVQQGAQWASDAWEAAKTFGGTVYRYLYESVSKYDWSDEAWDAVNVVGGTVQRYLDVTVSWFGDGISYIWELLTGATGGAFNGTTWDVIPQFASGGEIRKGANRFYSDIQRYAAGGIKKGSHGSLFLAGEAGPEIVGHVGGRTEILNKSQLASTMYSAVVQGMTLVGNSMLASLNTTIAAATNAISSAVLYDGSNRDIGSQALAEQLSIMRDSSEMQDGTAEMRTSMRDATERQNVLLREQNELLRQLLDKDTTVEITTNSFKKAATRQNQRDGRTIIPIGT